MATIEVPFETVEEIKEKLLKLEESFKKRYTKEDPWYDIACKREDRLVRIN